MTQDRKFILKPACQSGIALVMVLGALFALSLIIFGLAQRVKDESFVTGRDSRSLDARALAYTGVQLGLHPLTTVKTPALTRQFDGGHGYRVRLIGEGGKLNLNWLLVGEDPPKLQLLSAYFENKGLTIQERQTLIDSLLDWISPGETHHMNGTKTAVDGQPVPGRPFQDVMELIRVNGSQPLVRQTGWERDFTLLSQGPVDLQWAGEDVVGALPGVGLTRARSFVKQRRGKDGEDGTPDDMLLAGGGASPNGQIGQNGQNGQFGSGQSVPQVDPAILIPQLLGLSPNVYQNMVSNLVILNDPTTRVVSEGRAYDVKRTLEVVARKQGVQPQILSWKEY